MKELAEYCTEPLFPGVQLISTAHHTMYMYLLSGNSGDVLIDTGYGHGDLASVVRFLTEKPISVINTHGHPDHVGANDSFPTVYQLPGAKEDFRTAFGVTPRFSSHIIPVTDRENRFICGLPFSFMDCSSHSHSDLVILDHAHRILFVGDIIDPEQVLFVEYRQNETYWERIRLHLNAMERILSMENQFDHICPSHNGTPVDTDLVKRLCRLDRRILCGTAQTAPLDHPYMEKDPRSSDFRRVRGDGCSIIYREGGNP